MLHHSNSGVWFTEAQQSLSSLCSQHTEEDRELEQLRKQSKEEELSLSVFVSVVERERERESERDRKLLSV